MNIKDYYPIFYTENLDEEVKRFTEDLGFIVKHKPDIELLEYAVLENEKGRRVDLVCSHFPADSFSEGFLGMRANVDDFEAGVAYFESLGYSMFGTTHESDSYITALLTKGEGYYIVVFYHKNER